MKVTSVDELQQQLQELGIKSGDAVMVHASLRAIGPTEERAAGLVKALLHALGEEGTLLAYVDFEPTSELPYFDPERSPACFEHGVLAEVIRGWPGAIRSLNPGASVSAVGGKAQWFCEGHPKDYGYGPGSPFAKLVETEGYVLLLGAHLEHVTMLHHAEHCALLPNKRIIRRMDKCLMNGVVTDVETEEYDTSEPVITDMPEAYFSQVTRAFLSKGLAKSGPVGQVRSYLLPAADFVAFAIESMERDFGL